MRANDLVQLGMQQRLAAADGDDAWSPSRPSLIDAAVHLVEGTGLETSSYSLQYAQERLQRRMGMMCTCTGWSFETTPLPIIMIFSKCSAGSL